MVSPINRVQMEQGQLGGQQCGEYEVGATNAILEETPGRFSAKKFWKGLLPPGDSFTQFRFADEKDWASENLRTKQDSSIYLDSQSLVKTLQNLPLHLRLNVEANLVQEELPQELPLFIAQGISNMPMVTAQKGISASVASDHDSASQPETKISPDPSLSAHDEELDFLLSLDAPVIEKAATHPYGIKEPNQQLPCEEHATSTLKVKLGEAAEENPKAITSEDLEDWLDSMIS